MSRGQGWRRFRPLTGSGFRLPSPVGGITLGSLLTAQHPIVEPKPCGFWPTRTDRTGARSSTCREQKCSRGVEPWCLH